MSTAKQSGRLEFVEVGRGLAALAVVVFHSNSSARVAGWEWDRWMTILQHGVDFFFVLSGFIIYHAHRADIGRPQMVGRYLAKRAIRLLPMLWLVVGGWFLIRAGTGEAIDGEQLFRSLFPYPSLEPAEPQVVWTLRHEFVFYAIFAIAIAAKRVGTILFMVWGLCAIGQLIAIAAGHPVKNVPAFFLSAYTLDFLLGMGVAILHDRHSFRRSSVPLMVSIAILALAFVIEVRFGLRRDGLTDYISPAAGWWALCLGIIFAAVLHGLLCVEGLWKAPKFLMLLGGATYALYLVHTPVNAIAMRVLAIVPSDLLAAGSGRVILIMAGVATGTAAYLWVEKPVTMWLRKRVLDAPRAIMK